MEDLCVKIKTLQNNVFVYNTSKDTTICELQSKIENDSSVTKARQRLIYRGRLLKSQETLVDIGFVDSNTIHLVIRPENAVTADAIDQPSSQPPVPPPPVPRHHQPIQAAADDHHTADDLRNRLRPSDALRQSLLTIETLTSRLNGGGLMNGGLMNGGLMIFHIGQWIDAMDTMHAWLEAIIIDMRDDGVFVHYNGWNSHWDEWIGRTSDRIAPFRSRTRQLNEALSLSSPSPSVVDPEVIRCTRLAFTGENDATDITEVIQLSLDAIMSRLPLLSSLSSSVGLAPVMDRLGRLLSDVSFLSSSSSSSGGGSSYDMVIHNHPSEQHRQRPVAVHLHSFSAEPLLSLLYHLTSSSSSSSSSSRMDQQASGASMGEGELPPASQQQHDSDEDDDDDDENA